MHNKYKATAKRRKKSIQRNNKLDSSRSMQCKSKKMEGLKIRAADKKASDTNNLSLTTTASSRETLPFIEETVILDL